SGAGFGPDSRVFFDGSQAAQATFNSDGSFTVAPPPGASGQTATLTVYNSDGQNSMILQGDNPQTYTYPVTGPPQIAAVSPAALPAGSSAAVRITGVNTNFTDG